MIRIIFCVVFVLNFLPKFVLSTKMRLERVAVVHVDPEAVKDVTSFTVRTKRGDSYKTNVTCTLLQSWGNNVTGLIYYIKPHSDIKNILLRAKICDFMRIKWCANILTTFTDVPLTCPISLGTFHVTNLELSSSIFPIPLPEGENYIGLKYVRTRNEAVLIDLRGTLHVSI